jgi:hypothetical protein
MQLKLKVLEGSRVGTEVPVTGPKFFIGRDEDCQLRPRSDLISRHHCVLLVEPGYAAVRDFGSKNGTYVNGQRIEGEQTLKAGDKLIVGPLQFEIVIHHGVGGPKRPKVQDVKEAASRTASRASQDDMDIHDWLNDEEAAIGGSSTISRDPDASRVNLGEETRLSDTAELSATTPTDVARRSDEQTRIDPKSGAPAAAGTHDSTAGANDAKEADASANPPPSQEKSKDTQSAALDVLNQMRKNQQLKREQKQPKK